MNHLQEDRLSMFYSTRQVLDQHSAEVAGVPALATAKAELDANITSIEQLIAVQVKDLRGYTTAKEEGRTAMEEKTLEVAGGVMAWADATGNEGLAEDMNVVPSELANYRDSVVAQRCQGVATAAQDNAASVAPYGVGNADIVELQSRIDTYTTIVQQPRNLIVTRKSATSELGMLTRDTMRLLYRRMDMLMRGFKYSNAAFHRKYTDARIIIDQSAGNAAEVVVA